MKDSGLTESQLVDAYKKEVRSLVELAVPVWNSGLTLNQVIKIERVQKCAMSAILGTKFTSYEDSMKDLNLEGLSTRRSQICSKFISKNMKSNKPLLQTVKKSHNTRSSHELVKEFQCNSKLYYTSSLPFLARLFNINLKSKKKK